MLTSPLTIFAGDFEPRSDILRSPQILTGSTWINAQRQLDPELRITYTSSSQSIFETAGARSLLHDMTGNHVSDHKCIALLADAKNVSKFHVENVDCNVKAITICRTNIEPPKTSTPPTPSLRKLPCVAPMARKKRSSDYAEIVRNMNKREADKQPSSSIHLLNNFVN